LIAGQVGDALLVDIGSTTTDLVAVHNGRVQATGRSDFERLISGELVYTRPKVFRYARGRGRVRDL